MDAVSTHRIIGKTVTESVHGTTETTATGSMHGNEMHARTDGQVTRQSDDKRTECTYGWMDGQVTR